MYVCMYVCMYVYICMYVYMYIYISTQVSVLLYHLCGTKHFPRFESICSVIR